MSKKIDYMVFDQGTIFLFKPLTRRAARHLETHVASDSMWLGDRLVVEHRYARPLAEQLIHDGFRIQ